MPAAVVALVTLVGAETVGAAIISTIAAEVVVSSAVATAVGAAAISGTVAAIQGGSASEVLKAAVLGGASSYVGAYVGNVVGANVGAITGSPVATVIATNVAKNVTAAAITGRDLGTAALTGLAVGVPLMLGNLDAFAGLPEFAKNAISSATIAAVTGKDVGTAVVASALQSANILGSAINSNDTTRAFFADPNNKSAVTLVSNAFNYSMSATIQGRDVSKALEQSLVQSMTQIVASDANKNLKQYTKNAQDAYKTAQAQEQSVLAASTREANAITAYNDLNAPLREKYANQEALVADFNSKKATWQATVDSEDIEGANALVGGVNEAAAKANAAVEDLNTYYNANKNALDSAKAEYNSASSGVKAASESYNSSLATLKDTSSALDRETSEFQKYVDAETAKTVDPYETTMKEAEAFAVKYNLDPGMIENLAELTTGLTSELESKEALGEYKQSKASLDPEYADAVERGYNYAISQGRTAQEASQFADTYARSTLGREEEGKDSKLTFNPNAPEAMFGDANAVGPEFASPGTRLATMDEVMADQEAGGGKTRYDANINAWVTSVAPDIGELSGKSELTTKELADYQSGDGSYRVPNADGSFHKYNQYGVYMGLYSGNDSYIDYDPEASPIKVQPDFSDFPIQNFGGGEPENFGELSEETRKALEERGGFPVGWQTSGSDRIYIYDDGTGIGMNENGDPYALSEEDVTKMVDNGQLNTAASGYEFGSDTAGTSASTKYKNVPGANIPTFRMVNTPGGTPSFTDPAPRSSTSSGAPASSTSPSASAPSSALKSASETAQGSTLGKIPGSWVGGLGRSSAFIDPLSATEHLITGQEGSEDMYSTSPLAGTTGAQRREEEMSLQPEANYYSYGYEPSYSSIMQPYKNPALPDTPYARGGGVEPSPLMAARDGEVPHKGSHYVQGAGGGQDDLIDAKLADGEYVFDAEIVASLGDGSNKRGAEILDDWRENIRKHKRSASVKGIPPKAKSPLEYMKGIA